MALIVDLVILAIFIVCVAVSYKRGFAKCLIDVFAFIIAIVVSAVLFKPVSVAVVNNTQVDENIQTSIVNVFESEDEKSNESKEDNKEKNTETKVSSPVLDYISDKVKESTEEKKNEVVNSASREIALKIVDVLSFIAIFLVVRVVVVFLKYLADLITKLPLIKQCDKIGGIIYGFLQAAVIVFIGLALITFISTITGQYMVQEMVNQSYIGSILNSNNILLKVIF